MTLRRYLLSFLFVVLVLSLLCSFLPSVTRSHVLSGAVLEEHWVHDFVLGAGDDRFFIVDAPRKAELEAGVAYRASGPVKILSSTVRVTPKEVTWSKGKNRSVTAPGGQLDASVKWEALSAGDAGPSGAIQVAAPNGYAMALKSGSYQVQNGRILVREVTVHAGAVSLALGRLGFAMWMGLPLAAMAHSIWLLCMLPGIRRARAAADAAAEQTPLPRTFSPNPVAVWQIWAVLFLIFGFVTALICGIASYGGYFSTLMMWVVGWFLGAGVLIGLFVAWLVGRTLMSVRVDAESIRCSKFSDGRKPIQAPWSEVKAVNVKERMVKGVRQEWVEIVFPDGTARKFSESNLADYPSFRRVVETLYAHHHPAA